MDGSKKIEERGEGQIDSQQADSFIYGDENVTELDMLE